MPSIDLYNLAGLPLTNDIQLIQQIGAGGMGVVYRGVQKSLNRDVCVKFMQPDLVSTSEWQYRFRREAQVLAGIRHKHLARVYSVGLYLDVYPFIVMEMLIGSPLSKLIKQPGTLNWRTATELIIQICDAMSYVHEKGFVHRDLKPDNVFVCEEIGNFSSKILDFGLAGRNSKVKDTPTLTQTSDLLGTVSYMAPECFQQAQHHPSVDVYAIGCIFHEMLSGSPPFDGDSPVAIAFKHSNEQVPSLNSSVAPDDERAYLEHVIRQACSKSPGQRPTCEQLSQLLQSALEGDLTIKSSPADSQVERRRLRPPRSIVLALLLAVCSSLIVLLIRSSSFHGRTEPGLQAKLTLARQELEGRHDVQAANILKECLLDPEICDKDKFHAQTMMVETLIHRRAIRPALTYLSAALVTLNALDAPVTELEWNSILRLADSWLEKAGSQSSFGQLKASLSQLLNRSDTSDKNVRHIALLLAECSFPRDQTVHFANQLPGYADATDLLNRIPASSPELQKLYTGAALRLAQKMPECGEREASILFQLSIRLLASKDLRRSFQCARRYVYALNNSISSSNNQQVQTNAAGTNFADTLERVRQARSNDESGLVELKEEISIVRLIYAAHFAVEGNRPRAAHEAQEAYAGLQTSFSKNSKCIPQLALAINALAENEAVSRSLPRFQQIARVALHRIQGSRSSPLAGISLIQLVVQGLVDQGRCIEAARLAETEATQHATDSLTSAYILAASANCIATRDTKIAGNMLTPALKDLFKTTQPEVNVFQVLRLCADVAATTANAATFENFCKSSTSFRTRYAYSVDFAMAGLMHRENKDYQAMEWLFRPLTQTKYDFVARCSRWLFLELSLDDKIVWSGNHKTLLRQRVTLVHKELEDPARSVAGCSSPVTLSLSDLASMTGNLQWQREIIKQGLRSTKDQLELLVSLAELELDIDKAQKTVGLHNTISSLVQSLSASSPASSIVFSVQFARVQASSGQVKDGLTTYLKAVELAKETNSPGLEESVLNNIVYYTSTYWAQLRDEVARDPRIMGTVDRLIDRKPINLKTWAYGMALLEQLHRFQKNEALAKRCASRSAQYLNTGTSTALLQKAFRLHINERYSEASNYFERALLLMSKKNPLELYDAELDCYVLSLMHLAQYHKAIQVRQTIHRFMPLYAANMHLDKSARQQLVYRYRSSMAPLEYVCGNCSKSDQLWEYVAYLKAPEKESCRSYQLMLYANANDRTRGDRLFKSIEADLARHEYGASMRLQLELYDKITKRNEQPISEQTPGFDWTPTLQNGLAQLLTGDEKAAEQSFGKLFDDVIFPYDWYTSTCELYGAKLFLALRRKDNTEANRVLAHLRLTAGRVSPALTGRLVPILKCCESQTTSDSLRKQIRTVIDLSINTSKGSEHTPL